MHGLCWWENTNIPNFIYSSLTLGILNHDKVDVMCIIHSYNMGDKIRRMRMNVEFEYICQKEWSCLTYGRIVYLYIMFQILHDYDYHLPRIRFATFLAHLVKTMRSRKWCYEQA